jgi:hypothetical protein
MMKIANFFILICLVAFDLCAKGNALVDQHLATDRARSARAEVQVPSLQTAQEPAVVFAHRFLDLESISMPEQWNGLAIFFLDTPKPQWNKAHVVDIVDVGVDPEDDTTDVSISTNWLGDLDLSLQLSNYPSRRLPLIVPSTSACFGDHYFGFDLVLSHSRQDRTANGSVEQSERQLAWKIKNYSFEPIITLDAAIRYVKEMSTKIANPAIKKNASRTLAILNYFHNRPGKPLPSKLASAAGGACG